MSREIIAKGLVEKCLDVNGPFKFSNLKYTSPIRFNVDKLQHVPEIRQIIVSNLSSLFGYLTSIGGVASGGDLWAMGVSTVKDIPWFSVKKNGSILGRINGNMIGLVEDVVTTGRSLEDAASVILSTRGVYPIVATIFNYGLRTDIPSLVNLEDVIPYIENSVSYTKLKEINEWYSLIKSVT